MSEFVTGITVNGGVVSSLDDSRLYHTLFKSLSAEYANKNCDKFEYDSNLNVTQDTGTSILVQPGQALIYGRIVKVDTGKQLVITNYPTSGTSQSTICLTIDTTKNIDEQVFLEEVEGLILTQNNLTEGGTVFQMPLAILTKTIVDIDSVEVVNYNGLGIPATDVINYLENEINDIYTDIDKKVSKTGDSMSGDLSFSTKNRRVQSPDGSAYYFPDSIKGCQARASDGSYVNVDGNVGPNEHFNNRGHRFIGGDVTVNEELIVSGVSNLGNNIEFTTATGRLICNGNADQAIGFATAGLSFIRGGDGKFIFVYGDGRDFPIVVKGDMVVYGKFKSDRAKNIAYFNSSNFGTWSLGATKALSNSIYNFAGTSPYDEGFISVALQDSSGRTYTGLITDSSSNLVLNYQNQTYTAGSGVNASGTIRLTYNRTTGSYTYDDSSVYRAETTTGTNGSTIKNTYTSTGNITTIRFIK